jgi:hypothetical protein
MRTIMVHAIPGKIEDPIQKVTQEKRARNMAQDR